ncbi:MAG TPA: GNAT family N-acetyltransferase [Gemmatimonadales bacterium]|nr:GNAT family N-acetyltransferase [Gemmatimonadales bacterium]
MRAWLPERQLVGPERADETGIDGLNRVFADAFTDRYRRDGLVGVRVPYLNPQVWRYALLDAGDGAMLWRDESGDVAAFNIAHRSGAEAWMGPLAVRPDRQGGGVGKSIVRTAADWLTSQGAVTIGLETMPRTVENIGFYARLGYAPAYLTITMTKDIPGRGHPAPALLSARRDAEREECLRAIRQLITSIIPGPDFTREILLSEQLALGDTTLVEAANGLDAAILWHSAPLAEGRAREELRILKLAARDDRAFSAALAATEATAARAGIRRVAVRCQTRYESAFRHLVERGYRVRWTDLRMTLDGYPEPHAEKGVLFSNWEI